MNAVEHHGPPEHYLDDTTPTRMMSPLRCGPQLAIIVPTFNERGNIAELIRRLVERLGDRSWEVIFVDDDSP